MVIYRTGWWFGTWIWFSNMEIIIPTDYFLRWLKHVKTTNQRILCEEKSGWCVVPWKNRSLGAFGQGACVRRWMTVKPAQYDALSPCGLAALRLVNWEEQIFRVVRITGLFMFVLGFIMGYYIYIYHYIYICIYIIIYMYNYIYMCMIMYVFIYIEQGLAQNSYHIDVSNGKVQATFFINPWIFQAPQAPLVYPMTVL